MNTWIFVEMHQNPFDTWAPTDPNAFYSWGLRLEGSGWTVRSGMNFPSVQLLMQHFGVSNPVDLVGKSFESTRDDTSSALNLLLTQICHGGA